MSGNQGGTACSVQICKQGDEWADKYFMGRNSKVPVRTVLAEHVMVIENGTEGGKPVIRIYGRVKEQGIDCIIGVTTTAVLFNNIASIVKGATERSIEQKPGIWQQNMNNPEEIFFDMTDVPHKEEIKKITLKGFDTNIVSDGYHTFGELYSHRIALFITLAREVAHEPKRHHRFPVWRSKRHSDGEMAYGGDWFVLGIGKEPGEQMTYHLPISDWDKTWFAETLEQAPEFDGHSSNDVLNRLLEL